MVWPRHKFELKQELLFMDQFPIYEMNHSTTAETCSLLAQVISLHLQFVDSMAAHCIDVMPLEFFNQLSRGQPTFNSDDLFSFMLKLPIIFSTYDT